MQAAPVADYPPINHMGFTTAESVFENLPELLAKKLDPRSLVPPTVGVVCGSWVGLAAGSYLNLASTATASEQLGPLNELLSQLMQ